MKVLASALALVLVGLLGGWLWFDATSVARADTDGVVITGAISTAEAQALVEGGTASPDVDLVPAETAARTTANADPTARATQGVGAGGDVVLVDRFFEALGLSARELSTRAGDLRAERIAAEEAEAEAAEAAEALEAERLAAERREAERLEAERLEAERRAAEPTYVAPQPVQPVPVTPGPGCEWDDDGWDCDEPDDDGDDSGDDD
jgi:hypothetical protein